MTIKLPVFVSIFLATLCSCSVKDSSFVTADKKFEDFQIVNDNQILWQDILNQKEENYFIFVYGETCSNCHQIQEEVIKFAEDKIVVTYFIDTKKSGDVPISKDIEPSMGADKLEDISILGTPTLLEVEDKAIKANVPGKDDILSLLNEKRANQLS